MKLSELGSGESAYIVKVAGNGGFRKRIIEMGFVRGQKVTSLQSSPLNDPIKYSVMGYDISLRRSEAEMIDVITSDNKGQEFESRCQRVFVSDCNTCSGDSCALGGCCSKIKAPTKNNVINIALIGNPNSGKTSLFNILSGSKERVGNYSGVTVDAKLGHFDYKGYRFNITDLPGTYSLSAYSPEEIYVRQHLLSNSPDIIINAVVASNLERNLYLTTEIIDLNIPTVVALNMYDELERSGAQLDIPLMENIMGLPLVPTVARTGEGLGKLLDTVIEMFEGQNKVFRHIHINYGNAIEEEISKIGKLLRQSDYIPHQFPYRYWALKLIEKDTEALEVLSGVSNIEELKAQTNKSNSTITKVLGMDAESALSDYRYGFIAGALQETLTKGKINTNEKSRHIDLLVANKWLGFPIFLFLVWAMFYATFTLGAYPQEWIESAFEWISGYLNTSLPDCAAKDLLIDGILGGIGGIAVFIPNILILYLFISLMEDSGYMARAAFIMDRIMHGMGLHGKSFIPLIMGFGCNVPAIMAARTIESRSSRIITIMVTPFMSCSARLPVYLLLIGTFFPNNAASVLIGLYILGTVVAIITARILRRVFYSKDDTPFVMELPPYRIPTMYAVIKHMWEKCAQYLKKIGTVILLSTIVIWALSYYPKNDDLTVAEQSEQSYIGKIGKSIEPVMEPLGLDWRASIAIVTSIPAKELVVSSMGVLYDRENEEGLQEAIIKSGNYTPASSLAFMVFILLFFPCIATIVAVINETGNKWWGVFTIVYNTAVAWVVAYIVYQIALLVI